MQAKYGKNRMDQCFYANKTVIQTFAESFTIASCVMGEK